MLLFVYILTELEAHMSVICDRIYNLGYKICRCLLHA